MPFWGLGIFQQRYVKRHGFVATDAVVHTASWHVPRLLTKGSRHAGSLGSMAEPKA